MMINELREAEKAINRALLDVALKWGVDVKRASHNPVFWHEGVLNYYDSISHREEVFAYLKERGILCDGFNKALKLNFGLEQLHVAANADYNRGIDIDVVVGLLIGQLHYQFSELICFVKDEPGCAVYWSQRTNDIIRYLRILGYIEPAEIDAAHDFEWTGRAAAALMSQHLCVRHRPLPLPATR